MSSGHHLHTEPRLGEHETDQVLANPQVRALLARKPNVDYSYDIPYLAGYSTNGRTVYIDRHLPARALPVGGGRLVNVLPFLLTHETVEWAVLQVLKVHYQYAHQIASRAEDRAVRAAGYLPTKYNEWLEPYIKADQHEKLSKIPADLDLVPYIDSHDILLLHHLRSMMGK